MKLFSSLNGSVLWNSLEVEQRISLIALFGALGINIFVWMTTKDFKEFYLSLVLTLTGAIGADRVARFRTENKSMAALKQFSEYQERSPLDLHFVGNSVSGIEWFCKNYHKLIFGDNTVYRPSVGYIEQHYAAYFDAIRKAIDGGCEWRDYAPTSQLGAVKSFYESLTAKQRQRYTAYEIMADVPMFQLTVFQYSHDGFPPRPNKAVSFGWGIGTKESRVFMSFEERNVTYFEYFFTALTLQKKIRQVYGPNQPGPRNLLGRSSRQSVQPDA